MGGGGLNYHNSLIYKKHSPGCKYVHSNIQTRLKYQIYTSYSFCCCAYFCTLISYGCPLKLMMSFHVLVCRTKTLGLDFNLREHI